METNSKKMMEELPDFEEMFKVIEEIKSLNIDKMRLEKEVKQAESDCFNLVMSNSEYEVNGKSPSVSYFDNAYKFNGLSGEILEIREKLILAQACLEEKKLQYELYKEMLDMFKTVVYQERGMV
jgi:hypothetical protein